MQSRILITGSDGLVGKNLQCYINEYNKKNNVDDKNIQYFYHNRSRCDLKHKEKLKFFFEKHKYTHVIHLASKVGGLYMNMKNNIQMLIDNIKINMNLLELCNEFNVQRGIFCLSSCCYPKNPSKYPMTEEMLLESEAHETNEGYSYSKRLMYIMCKHYNKQYNRDYICLSPVNIYGMFDNFNLKSAHIIPSVIHKMYLTKNQIKPFDKDNYYVFGKGVAQRQFLFATDFACIVHTILWDYRIDKNNMLINICNDEEQTIKSVVELISNIFEFDTSNIVYDANYSDGIIKKTVSNKLFRSFYKDYKFINLEDGIYCTIEWFKNNFGENIRI